MSRFAAAALLALAGLSSALPAAAAEWKWRDAAGRIVYSDRPPPANVPDKAILQRPKGLTAAPVPPSPTGPSLVPGQVAVVPTPAAPGASAPKGAEPALEAIRRKELEAKAAQQKAEEGKVAAQRAENCTRARDQLRQLDSGVRIARTNAKGEREILDDKARAAEAERARAIMASDCKAS
jgi:Domain of unknown function (DUF4124)